MIEQTFSISHLEYYLAILVRVMGTLAYAPIFSTRIVTRRVRVFIGIGTAMVIFMANPYVPLGYTTFLEYTVILIRELVIGVSIGFMAGISLSVITMAGHFIDREMGFSMVANFDQTFNMQTTITAEYYNMLVMLIMLCSNMHYFVISALADSFTLIPLGNGMLDSGSLYDIVLQYMNAYLLLSLRISLPVMVAIMLLNVVLGVLAKTAPQMNMFVVGIQMKVFVGLTVVFVTLGFLPSVTDFLYHQMQEVVADIIEAFAISG